MREHCIYVYVIHFIQYTAVSKGSLQRWNNSLIRIDWNIKSSWIRFILLSIMNYIVHGTLISKCIIFSNCIAILLYSVCYNVWGPRGRLAQAKWVTLYRLPCRLSHLVDGRRPPKNHRQIPGHQKLPNHRGWGFIEAWIQKGRQVQILSLIPIMPPSQPFLRHFKLRNPYLHNLSSIVPDVQP